MRIFTSWLLLVIAVMLSVMTMTQAQQITLSPTDDAYVRGGANSSSTNGVSDATLLRVRGTATAPDNLRSVFLKFDLSTINGTVTSATLKLTVSMAANDKKKLDRADFYAVSDDSWSESTICWDNAPARGVLLFSPHFQRLTSSMLKPDTTYYFDITQNVLDELAFDKVMSICAYDDSLNGTDLRFHSKESFSDSSRPMLIIETGSTEVESRHQLPTNFTVSQNYPNPFNPQTMIRFELAAPANVTAEVYDLLGHRVKTLAAGRHAAGTHRVVWQGDLENGRSAAAGVYLARLQSNHQIRMVKMLLVK